MPIKPVRLCESHIQRTCDDWLALDGWRRVITDPPRLRGLGVTEPGIADGLYLRYGYIQSCEERGNECQHVAEVMWIEWKKPKGRISQAQRDWHAAERARGALTLIAGSDFHPTIEDFQAWYRKSGLRRNQSL